MAHIGVTEEQREQLIELYYKQKNIERKRPSKKELEKEIIEYLGKKHPCSLATCGKDGIPRISVVDYMNDGLTIYILSEGGQKFQNILENNHVAIGIGTSARTSLSVRGVNIQGIAEIFDDTTKEFAHALELFKPIIASMVEDTGGKPLKIPKGAIHLIRVKPTKMVYRHNKKGIKNAHWSAA
ncbi:MAG: pyridoxamine 5'-phosphate oxidase family protein [Deltaproteobacteria bacterium]|nr:pyridoxamine 5'-phosphate oxidase family protein [Deltaproteobacteria bacterium]